MRERERQSPVVGIFGNFGEGEGRRSGKENIREEGREEERNVSRKNEMS